MPRDKTAQYLGHLQMVAPTPNNPNAGYHAGICLIKLGRYTEARDWFRQATRVYVDQPRFWQWPGIPNVLTETHVLAGRPLPLEKVRRVVETYRLDRRGASLIALYAYATLRLLAGLDLEAREYVPAIAAYPKYRDLVAISQVIDAMAVRDHAAFDAGLQQLLDVHRGKATHGELRTSSEAFLCMSAMCLCALALDRGMAVTLESEYLSLGYLQFLQSQSPG